jgi:hypothetical protein
MRSHHASATGSSPARVPKLEYAVGSADSPEVSSHKRNSVSERLSDPSISNKSKLAVRKGEIGIVSVPSATMEHLTGKLFPSAAGRADSPRSPQIVVTTIDALLDMLGEKGLGRSTLTQEAGVSLGISGWTASMDTIPVDDSAKELVLNIQDESGSGMSVCIGGLSEGSVSEGSVSEGAVSEGAVSEGAVSEGAVSEGIVMVWSSGDATQDGFLFFLGGEKDSSDVEQDAGSKGE